MKNFIDSSELKLIPTSSLTEVAGGNLDNLYTGPSPSSNGITLVLVPGSDLNSGTIMGTVPIGKNVELQFNVGGNMTDGVTGASMAATWSLD